MPSDQEAAYAIFERGNLKRLMVINMHGYNTTKDGAGTEPLPNPPGRMSRGFSFAARNLARDVSIREQRHMANGSDAITGVTFDGWSYNWELDNGKPVRLDNVTTGETVRSKQGVITVMVPDKMVVVVVVVVVVVEKTLDEDGALESRSS
ncbi:Beta-glucuronidase [Metarhizium brunneum]|uniref:Beta-glucuronidase n=1 Tax=Metarhizium brunneum TaxID=500148 RepID=A0A7D5YYL5_9HYPO|nr:Beta-glucuronidase [Metarhizium brunneum]